MKTFRRSIALLLLCLLLPFPQAVTAEEPIQIYLDGQALPSDVPPVIAEDRTLVPMRTIFEALGYTVSWDDVTKVVTGSKGNTTLLLQVGNEYLQKNDQSIRMDLAPQIVAGRTMVPLRAVAEATGAAVGWDQTTRTVTISTGAAAAEEEPESLFDGVVMITTNKTQGSGFVLKENGIIVTNCHVIAGASVIAVTFTDGSVYMDDVSIVGFDVSRDMVALKINKTGLTALPIGDVAAARPGDPVVAIGAPEGSQNTVTAGRITDVNDHYIVSDAVIQHGNSGGVLLNGLGQVIGIPSFSAENNTGTQYFSQRADYLKQLSLSGDYSLSAFTAAYRENVPPQHFTVTQEGNQIFLDWEMLNDVQFYMIFESDTIDGEYTAVINPAVDLEAWFWNYPHCFGLTVSGHGAFTKYYKVATVRNEQVSAFSDPVMVSFRN